MVNSLYPNKREEKASRRFTAAFFAKKWLVTCRRQVVRGLGLENATAAGDGALDCKKRGGKGWANGIRLGGGFISFYSPFQGGVFFSTLGKKGGEGGKGGRTARSSTKSNKKKPVIIHPSWKKKDDFRWNAPVAGEGGGREKGRLVSLWSCGGKKVNQSV